MSLFNQIASAISDPNLQANVGQLGSIVSTLQQTGGTQNLDASKLQPMMSVVGKYVRASLQEKRNANGEGNVRQIVNQFSGTSANLDAVRALFSPQEEQQVAENASRETGIDLSTVRSLLPVVVPLILQFLQTGSNANNPQGEANPILNNFLDADGDGDVDMGDALSMASKYLNQ